MLRVEALVLAGVTVVFAAACGSQPAADDPIADLFSGAAAEWIDMSYAYDQNTIFWPTAQPFELEVVSAQVTEAGYYYAANNFCTAEHGGTHLDAPVHFAKGKHASDQIPVQRLIGSAIVIDVSESARDDPDYQVSVADLEAWERRHGRVPEDAIVLLRTGWGARWPDRASYLGTVLSGPEAVPQLHFPGLHPETARWLAEGRRVDAVGIDTPSIDYGQSELFESHQILFARNIPVFENVAALDRLPETGAYVIALPMKIAGGSGGPLRMLGVVPRSLETGGAR